MLLLAAEIQRAAASSRTGIMRHKLVSRTTSLLEVHCNDLLLVSSLLADGHVAKEGFMQLVLMFASSSVPTQVQVMESRKADRPTRASGINRETNKRGVAWSQLKVKPWDHGTNTVTRCRLSDEFKSPGTQTQFHAAS